MYFLLKMGDIPASSATWCLFVAEALGSPKSGDFLDLVDGGVLCSSARHVSHKSSNRGSY